MSRSLVGSSQDEHVGLGQQQAQELQPPPLATGQVADAGLLARPGEAEPLGQRAGADLLVAEPGVLADVLDRLDHPPVGHLVQLADLLGQVGHRHRLAHLAQAAAERDVTVDRPHQGRLPGAVDADDADPVPGREPPGDPLQQLAVAQGHRRVDEVDDVLAEARGGEPDQVDLVAGGRLVRDQRRGGLDAELRLAGPRRRAAAQPGQLLAQQVAPPLLGDGLHPVALRLGQHVRRVATVVGVDLPLGHLPGGRGHGVEEPPVVGDGDEGGAAAGAPGGQVVGQPGHPLDVEVVGRLVQQEQVGVGHEQLGQREPPPLTAGHRPDQRLQAPHVGRVDAAEQALEHVAHPGVTGPDVLGRRTEHGRADGRLGVQRVDLRQHADGEAADVGHAPLVDLLPAGQHPQQGGLAAAVAADHADALAGADAERDVGEDEGGAEGEGRPLDGDEVGHGGSAAPGSVVWCGLLPVRGGVRRG